MPTNPSDSDSLECQVKKIAARTPYSSEAFMFVLQTAPYSISPISPTDHVTAAELCSCLRDHANAKFGSNALGTLRGWSVHTCDDFGTIVYSLIDAGLMRKTEKDSIDDFHNVFDFDVAFNADAKPKAPRARFQWRLSSLLWITTVAAIASMGFAKLGFEGAIGTVYSSWIGLIGVVLLIEGLKNRTKGWIFAACAGAALCLIAAAMFFGITADFPSQ